MKRDLDLVRSIMLMVEEHAAPALLQTPDVEGHDRAEVLYHLNLLVHADYLNAIDASTFDGPDFLQITLTWQGHELLETMRDGEVWAKTKAGAKKVGSWSVGLLAELGKGFIREKAHQLGLPI